MAVFTTWAFSSGVGRPPRPGTTAGSVAARADDPPTPDASGAVAASFAEAVASSPMVFSAVLGRVSPSRSDAIESR